MPDHWGFYIQGSGVPIPCCGTWHGSMHQVHVALQELQAFALVLCKMAFWLSSKVVALHLNNSNQGGTASLFL